MTAHDESTLSLLIEDFAFDAKDPAAKTLSDLVPDSVLESIKDFARKNPWITKYELLLERALRVLIVKAFRIPLGGTVSPEMQARVNDLARDMLNLILRSAKERLKERMDGKVDGPSGSKIGSRGDIMIVEDGARWVMHADRECPVLQGTLVKGTTIRVEMIEDPDEKKDDKKKKGDKKKDKTRSEKERVPAVIPTSVERAAGLMKKAGYKVCDDCGALEILEGHLQKKLTAVESTKTPRAWFQEQVQKIAQGLPREVDRDNLTREAEAQLLRPNGFREIERYTEFHNGLTQADVRMLFMLPKVPVLPEHDLAAAETKFFAVVEKAEAELRLMAGIGADRAIVLRTNIEMHRRTLGLREVFTKCVYFRSPWTVTSVMKFFLGEDLSDRSISIISDSSEFDLMVRREQSAHDAEMGTWNAKAAEVRSKRAALFAEAETELTNRAAAAAQKVANDAAAEVAAKTAKDAADAAHHIAEHVEIEKKADEFGRSLGLTDAEMRGDFSKTEPAYKKMWPWNRK